MLIMLFDGTQFHAPKSFNITGCLFGFLGSLLRRTPAQHLQQLLAPWRLVCRVDCKTIFIFHSNYILVFRIKGNQVKETLI